MAIPANTLPELDRRLRETRGAMVQTVDALRTRVRQDIHELSPVQQLKHRPAAAIAVAALAGWIAGRIAARLLAALFR